jgi:hypothetical protein
VSLSWLRKRHLRIGLGASRVIVSGAGALELAPSPPGAEGWRSALEALPGVLKAHPSRAASVILADQFVRYALLPASEAVKTDEQWLGIARHRFSALHGAPVAEWDIQITPTAARGPRLACAVDQALVAAIASACESAGVRLASVQPFLVAAFNRLRGRIGGGSCWIVVEEAGRLTLALIERGAWLAVRTRRADERWRIVLPEILERESALLGLEKPCTRLIVCAQGEFDARLHDAWRADALSYRSLALGGRR